MLKLDINPSYLAIVAYLLLVFSHSGTSLYDMYNITKEMMRGKVSFEILNWILSRTLQFKFEHFIYRLYIFRNIHVS